MKRLLPLFLAVAGAAGTLALWLVLQDVPASPGESEPPARALTEEADSAGDEAARDGETIRTARRAALDAPGDAPSEPRGTRGGDGVDPDTGAPVIFGIVRETGTRGPLAGATVELLGADPWLPASRRREAIETARSDARGAFRIPGVDREHRYQVRVSADRHESELATAVPGRRLEIDLSSTLVLQGTVREAETEIPLEGVTVGVGGGGSPGPWARIEAKTDERGGYRLEGVVAGRSTVLVASRPDHAPASLTLRTPRGREATVDLELERGRILEGRVVDARTRTPVAGARIEESAGRLPPVLSDATGRFVLRVPRDATWLSRKVSSEGTCESTFRLRLAPGTPLDPVVIPLVPGAGIDGIVRDEAGLAVAGARIEVREERTRRNRFPGAPEVEESLRAEDVPAITLRSGRASIDVVSGEDGRFHIDELVPCDLPKHVVARHRDHAPSTSGTLVLPAPGIRAFVELVLGPPCRVEGRVTRNGEPAEAVVHWGSVHRAGAEPFGGGGRIPTDGAGWYTTDPLPPGEVSLLVRLEGLGWSRDFSNNPQTSAKIRLAPGERVRHDFEVTFPESVIEGRVRTPEGEGVAGASVSLFPSPGEDSTATFLFTDHKAADPDGRFRFEVPAGEGLTYRATATRGAARVTVEDIPPGTKNLVLVLAPSGTLRLRVLDEETGEIVPGVRLFLRDPGSPGFDHAVSSRRLRPDSTGLLEIPLLLGTYDVWVHADAAGYLPQRVSGIRVSGGDPENQPEPTVARLRRGTRVEMHWKGPGDAPRMPKGHAAFVLPDGEPLPFEGPLAPGEGANWSAPGLLLLRFTGDQHDRYAHELGFVSVDEGGQQVFSGLAPGRYRIAVVPPDLEVAPERFTVPQEGPLRLEMSWRRRQAP